MKIEVIITVWEDGLFRLRDRIEADNFESLDRQYLYVRENIEKKLEVDKFKRHRIADDDDIPF